jgi:hypothetical protein
VTNCCNLYDRNERPESKATSRNYTTGRATTISAAVFPGDESILLLKIELDKMTVLSQISEKNQIILTPNKTLN